MSGGAFGAFLAVLGREWKLALRHPADTLAAVLFFVLVAALFPFGVGRNRKTPHHPRRSLADDTRWCALGEPRRSLGGFLGDRDRLQR